MPDKTKTQKIFIILTVMWIVRMDIKWHQSEACEVPERVVLKG